MWFFGILIAVYIVLFLIQKNLVIYAERKISKFIPLMTLTALNIFWYIINLLEIQAHKRSPAATSMGRDSIDIIFGIGESFIVTGAVICIAGLIYGAFRKRRMNKKAVEQQKNKFQIRL